MALGRRNYEAGVDNLDRDTPRAQTAPTPRPRHRMSVAQLRPYADADDPYHMPPPQRHMTKRQQTYKGGSVARHA